MKGSTESSYIFMPTYISRKSGSTNGASLRHESVGDLQDCEILREQHTENATRQAAAEEERT